MTFCCYISHRVTHSLWLQTVQCSTNELSVFIIAYVYAIMIYFGCVYFHFLFIKIHFSNIDHHLALPILVRLKSISNCNKAAHQLALLSVKKTYGLEQWRRRFWMHSRFILRWDEGNSGVLWSKKSSVQTITLCERKNYLIALFDKF